MKKYLFLGLAILLPSLMNAQLFGRFSDKKVKKASEEFYNKVMEYEAEDFETTEVPEKWKDEPMVMLCQKLLMAAKLQLREGYANKVVVRKRLKIQDKSVLEDYSTFYFSAKEFVSVKVVKPDGKIIEVDMSKAAEVDTEVPKEYRGFFRSEKYYKTAIPNLEVGDILDYTKVFTEYTVYACEFYLDTEISFDYPVVYQKFVFDADVNVQLKYNTFNDSPKFKQLTGGEFKPYLVYTMGAKRLVLEDRDREASSADRWYFPNRYEPIIKVSMYRVLKGGITIGGDPKNMTNLNWEKYLNSAARMSSVKAKYSGDEVKRRLKKWNKDLDKMNMEQKVNAIHRATRYVMSYTISTGFSPYSPSHYMGVMTELLEDYKIPFEYVITTPRDVTVLEEVLFPYEFVYGVYIPKLDKYYWYQSVYSVAGESRTDLAGNIGKKRGKQKKDGFKDAKIPATQSGDNLLHTEMNITLAEDNSMLMSNKITYSGGHRYNYFGTLVSSYEYAKDEEMAISDAKTKEKLKKAKPDAIRERLKEIDTYKEENVKELIESDYEIDELLEHKVVEYGNTNKSPNLILEYQCTSDAYVSKAGNNLILELGRFISSQVELTEEEIENRTRDVQYDFAREFVHEVNITLPEGYIAKGLEQFNMKVDHEHAAFISSVVQEGNVLKLKASKSYKSQTVAVEHWSQLVEMLEAAYNFTQKKVILSKN